MALANSVKKLANKIKKSIASYSKNVVGGAKIVGSAIKNVTTKVGNALKASGGANVISVTGGGTSGGGTRTLPAAETAQPDKVRVYDSGGNSTLVSRTSSQGQAYINTRTSKQSTPEWWGNPVQNPRNVSAGSRTTSTTFSTPTYNTFTLSSSSLGGTSSGSTGTTAPISLASAPSARNPGMVNSAGNAGQGFQYDPNTGQLIADPVEAEMSKNAEEMRQLEEIIRPKRESVYDDRDVRKQQREINKQKQIVNEYASQLNAVIAKQNQDLLQLRQTGSEEGVTEAVYGGQALTINREAAIKALPIQAALSAAQGNLELAQDYLTELITIKKEQIDNDYEFKKSQFDSIKELVSGNQKVRLDRLVKAEDRAYQEKQKAMDKIQELLVSASSQGASAQVLSRIANAPTVNDAITAAGRYSGDILSQEIKRKQLEDLYGAGIQTDRDGRVVLPPQKATVVNKEIVNNDAYKSIRKGQDSLQYLTEFEKTLDDYGSTSQVFDPKKNAELSAKYNAAVLNLKEFFNLGVLNGPDEAIIKSIITDPTNRSNVAKIAGLGIYQPGTSTKKGIETMKKQIETTLDDRYQSLVAQYGDYSPESVGTIRDLQRVYLQQKSKLNPEVARMMKENPDMTYEEIISVMTNQ